MCKGYAIVINDKKIIGKGNSHSDIFRENNLKEDEFLKVNIIYDDSKERGYRIDIDKHDEDKNDTQLKHYQELGMVTKEGDIISSYLTRIVEYCQEKEAEVFRVLCRNMQSATIEGHQFNSSATIEGHQINDSTTIEGYQSNYSATIEGYQSNDSATIEGYQSNYSATIEGYQSNYSATIEGYQSNDSATIEGDQINDSTTIEGDQFNYSATIKGDQINDSTTIEGDIILFNTIIGDKDSETSKLIKEFSEGKEWRECTLTNLLKWVRKDKNKEER